MDSLYTNEEIEELTKLKKKTDASFGLQKFGKVAFIDSDYEASLEQLRQRNSLIRKEISNAYHKARKHRTVANRSQVAESTTGAAPDALEVTNQNYSAKEIENHIVQGFKIALTEINKHIYQTQCHIKPPFRLQLEDFSETRHEVIPQTNLASFNVFSYITVEYDLTMPFRVPWCVDLVDFSIKMSLENESDKAKPSPAAHLSCDSSYVRPQGPHIAFEVCKKGILPFEDHNYSLLQSELHLCYLEQGIKGHVPLSMGFPRYTAKECHIAGDLILPTTSALFQASGKYCEVLIIGDSILKDFGNFTDRIESSDVKVYPCGEPIELNNYIPALNSSWRGVKCVVLYIGSFRLDSQVNKQRCEQLARDVITVATELSRITNCAKIIICSKLSSRSKLKKINQNILIFNNHLDELCWRNHYYYLDVNKFVQHWSIKSNGYFTNTGYKKLGRCVASVVKVLTAFENITISKNRHLPC